MVFVLLLQQMFFYVFLNSEVRRFASQGEVFYIEYIVVIVPGFQLEEVGSHMAGIK